jgi:DmsE family decaheme c-type cytochrome
MARCSSAITFATSLLFVLLLALPFKSALAQTDPQVCLGCHQNQAGVLQNKHGVKGDARSPLGSGKACSACHGENAAHPSDPAKNPLPVRYGPTVPAEQKNAACMTCHTNNSRIHWGGSAHDRTRVACSDCHDTHAVKDQVLVTQTQAGVCFNCHKDVRSQVMRFSAHPLRSGQMACSSCHQPHGSVAEFQMVKNSVNETCYTCHAAQRGPFLWEHPPARENCAECHSPHGSNNAPLLKSRGPYLCQQCHLNPFHPSTNYSGSNLPPNAGADKMLGQNCMNCHPKVHGSNHPSGARFTR